MKYKILEKQYLLGVYPFRGLTIIKGEGAHLIDSQGKKYLDMMSNYGVNIFGYSNREIITALQDQIEELTNLHGSFTNNQRSLASQALLKKCNRNSSKVYWANSGSEAIESALKFATFATGKKKFISAKNSFHGKTLGALSATGEEKYKKPFIPLLWNFVHVDFGKSKAIEQAIDRETAAVILEPIQGEAGIIIPPENYLKEVKEICQKNNVLMIVDEIQTGMARTGSFLASSDEIEPEILCLGKALGAGIPAGAVILSDKIALQIKKGVQSSTFGGNPLTARGALTVLNMINQELLSRINELGEYFLKNLSQIKSKEIKEVRGKGLMLGIELYSNNSPVLKALQEKGILAIPAGENIVRFLPPFIITKDDINQTVRTLKEILI